MLAHNLSLTHFNTMPTPPSTMPTSTKRRKPTLTYRSPQSISKASLSNPYLSSSKARPPSSSHSSSSAPSPLSKWSHTPEDHHSFSSSSRCSSSSYTERDTTPRLRDRNTSSFLPLYHPFGPLAMSLPPLDPVAHGLPASPRLAEAHEEHSPRSRKQGERDFQGPDPTVPEPVPEKSSPRKRRNNGSSGAASKRRRKEYTEGDTAYPTKRTRSNKQSFPADLDPEAEAIAEMVAEERRVSTRRTTRSRVPLARRNSSGSEDAASNASGPAAAPGNTIPEEALDDDTNASNMDRTTSIPPGSNAALNALSHQAQQGLASLISNLDQELHNPVPAQAQSSG